MENRFIMAFACITNCTKKCEERFFNIKHRNMPLKTFECWPLVMYSRLSLSRSQRDPLKNFEISVLRHNRFAELRQIPIKLPNFTNEHVIRLL